ncbi:MAG: rod shape-determining protein RodA [Alphaproteobacteria bacterium RIFCSPLOWO2_01_FULL_40_26]|nr:MAG: rod shape-determining protein RodA [Alphaproteobacteria bacterium RIFCSPHIGHO2_02_FULL_40_34]OFW94515.1 MAG: rod shape-determining protein RodA [Alphaproteobacteria bacterium RIFCSPLOWO2_01_FULL_40_26]OFX10223.1 MAG: rod shape-determining protein RodA [Alphaproteobacteria bacterium RIFCSPLOWO2_02_FULL_40_19]
MNIINQEKIPQKFFLAQKLEQLNWTLISLVIILAFFGFMMLYSAGGGSLFPWLIRQFIFFCLFFPLMLFIAITDIKIWFRFSYPLYAAALILVIIVDIMGHNAMGATRWFRVGPIAIQPSEIMKICTVLALARYFYSIEIANIGRIRFIMIPLLLITVPALFIFHQPDLGTATILILVGVLILFIAGVKMWKFFSAGAAVVIAIPFVWNFLLYDYQKKRVLTFLNPSEDPLGSGYNIIQSKIAIGSGGMFGKGYLNGTQGQLNFLPEKQTDFIFTMLSEELGFIGSIFVIGIYCAIIAICLNIAVKTRHQYGRLLVMGVIGIFFLHMFINIGMVMGLLPVVGAPLPFISYGGTIMASMMIGFGLVLNVDVNRNESLGKG